MIRLAGESAGALCMGSERFVNELKAVKKSVAYRVEAAMAKVNGEAMRPEKLWGTQVFSSSVNHRPPAKRAHAEPKQGKNATSSTESKSSPPVEGAQETGDGRFVYTGRFGRSAVIIEDKRKKPTKRQDGTQ